MVGVLVDLPFLPHRPVCLPILARLWWPKHTPGQLELAVDAVTVICSVTTRLRADAALYQLPTPRRPGQRGRTPPEAPASAT